MIIDIMQSNHLRDTIPGNLPNSDILLRMWTEQYTKAGTIETVSLEDAYQLSNNIQSSWVDNPEVISHNGPARSTSVGDVFLVRHEDPRQHEFWMVAPAGFERLTTPKSFGAIIDIRYAGEVTA
jgi:hypothetical protein